MKHFEIDYFVGTHTFTFKCTSASEAYDALIDLFKNHLDYFLSDLDYFMDMLVRMKNGTTNCFGTHLFAIRYVDGEV